MIKVAIIEDNKILRETLTQLFKQTDGLDCEISLANLNNVVSEFKKHTPDIVLMDIGLPQISGIEGAKIIKENFKNIEVLMFTVFEDEDKIFAAIQAGATGYLLKKSTPAEIIDAIIDLFHGGAPMSAKIARKVIHSFQNNKISPKENFSLTTRESEILYALVDGLSYKKVGDKFNISISTVRTHICHIYEKLHVQSKAQAVAKILR